MYVCTGVHVCMYRCPTKCQKCTLQETPEKS
jgi:hypothetical protein